jgi:hypothetical protein
MVEYRGDSRRYHLRMSTISSSPLRVPRRIFTRNYQSSLQNDWTTSIAQLSLNEQLIESKQDQHCHQCEARRSPKAR